MFFQLVFWRIWARRHGIFSNAYVDNDDPEAVSALTGTSMASVQKVVFDEGIHCDVMRMLEGGWLLMGRPSRCRHLPAQIPGPPRTNVSRLKLTHDIHSGHGDRQRGKYVYTITPNCIFGISNRDPHRRRKKNLFTKPRICLPGVPRALTTTPLLHNPEISMAQSPVWDCDYDCWQGRTITEGKSTATVIMNDLVIVWCNPFYLKGFYRRWLHMQDKRLNKGACY